MAKKIFIDARVTPNGKKSHINMDNVIDLSKAIATLQPSIPPLAGNPYIFKNGLNAVLQPGLGTEVKLGGELVNNTTIDGVGIYDLTLASLNGFLLQTKGGLINAKDSLIILVDDTVNNEKASLTVEKDTFRFFSDDGLATYTYNLPCQQKHEEGDIMIMNANEKAEFFPLEREVYLPAFNNMTTGSTLFFQIPISSGNWTLRQVSVHGISNTVIDTLQAVIQSSNGTNLSNVFSVNMTTPTGATNNVFGNTNSVVFTHSLSGGLYRLNIVSTTAIVPYTTAYFVFTFGKTF